MSAWHASRLTWTMGIAPDVIYASDKWATIYQPDISDPSRLLILYLCVERGAMIGSRQVVDEENPRPFIQLSHSHKATDRLRKPYETRENCTRDRS